MMSEHVTASPEHFQIGWVQWFGNETFSSHRLYEKPIANALTTMVSADA